MRDDAAAVAALIVACQAADGDIPDSTGEEVLSDWGDIDLAEEAIVILTPDGRIAAYADVLNRRYIQVAVYGYVDPVVRGQGLGTYLVRWGEAWANARAHLAPAEASIVVDHMLRESNAEARQLVEADGYMPVRIHYLMSIVLDGPPPQPVWPDGIAIRTFVLDQDDHALFEVGEAAFSDIWGRPPSTVDRWLAPTLSDDFDPGLWLLPEEAATGTLAGFCLCRIVEGQARHGVVNQVGVQKEWRRHGLGLAMLHHAFGVMYQRGVREIFLSVDAQSRTGAPRVYSRAGMQVQRSYVRYRKQLRSGEDLSTATDG